MRRRRPTRFASSVDLAGGAFDPGLLVLLERLAGGRLGVGPDLLGGLQQPAPGFELGGAVGPDSPEDCAFAEAGPTPLRAQGRGAQLPARGRRAGSGPARRRRPRAAPRRRPPPASPSSAASTASVGSAAKSTGWQREEIVSSSASGSELSRIRWAKPGGSSSVFSSAFWLSSRIASAASTTKTRLLALEGPVGGGADHPLAHRLDQVLGAARRQPDQVRDGARGRAGRGGGRRRGPRRRRRGSRRRRRAPRRACRRRAGRGRGRRATGPTRAPRRASPRARA